MMSPLPHVLFDMYGVLLKMPTAADQRRVEQAAGQGADVAEQLWPVYEELRPALDAGLVSDVAFWRQIGLRLRQPDLDVYEAISADYAPCVEAQPEVVEVARELVAAGHCVGVLSNIPATLAARVRSRHAEWLDTFDSLTFSCDIGVAKPDPRAYEVAVDAMGVAAQDTLFVDDRRAYLAGAEAAGLRTHLFTGVPALRRALEDFPEH